MDWSLFATIVVAVISSSALTEVVKYFTNKREKKFQLENDKKIKYLENKEQVYVSAIEWLLCIRRGFNINLDKLRSNDKLRDEYLNEVQKYSDISAKLRLYSTDEIYNIFYALNQYQKYSYKNNIGLSEETKVYFSNMINHLSNLMKKDLGYRVYDDNPFKIKCPKCGFEHDYLVDCKCGLTFKESFAKINEINISKNESE